MTRMLQVVLMTVLALFAGVCMAGEQKADPRSVETLMVKSGLGKQLEQLAPMVQAGMDQQNEASHALTPGQLRDLKDMAGQAYDAQVLKENVRKHLQENLSEAEIQAALAWLRSPLGEKITRMEEDASTPAAYEEMSTMADKLAANAGRVDLAGKLDRAVKATDTGVAIALNTQTALIAAMTSAMPREKLPTMKQIEQEVARSREQVRSSVEQSTLLSFLYTYRSLSDAEISKYIDFARSASGKKYQAVVSEAVIAAVTNSARVLGSSIAENADKKTPTAGQQNI